MVGWYIADEGGLYVVAAFREIGAEGSLRQNRQFVFSRNLQISLDPRSLRLIDHWTKVEVLARRPHAQRSEAFRQLGGEFVISVVLNKNARAGAACLACILRDSFDDRGTGLSKVCVRKDDLGRLSAEFKA